MFWGEKPYHSLDYEIMHHLLEIDSVIKNFGTRQLLSDVYLRINTGDVIGLFGRNGTGKSVLMQIIFGTMKADRKFTCLTAFRR